jgi:hypothetical protein
VRVRARVYELWVVATRAINSGHQSNQQWLPEQSTVASGNPYFSAQLNDNPLLGDLTPAVLRYVRPSLGRPVEQSREIRLKQHILFTNE